MSEGNRDGAGTGEAFKVHGSAAIRTRGRGPNRNGPVTVISVNPRALVIALRLADRDPNRLRYISYGEILVVNDPRKP